MAKYKNIKSEHQLRSLVFDDYFKSKDISWEQEIDKIIFVPTKLILGILHDNDVKWNIARYKGAQRLIFHPSNMGGKIAGISCRGFW
ncbi:hypothetical protein R84B8_02213 [Treponema sp. R8-4-B8]